MISKREAVGVDPAGRQAQEHVAGPDLVACDHLALLDGADAKAGNVIFVFRVEPVHFRRFAANEGAARFPAGPGDTFDNVRHLLGIDLVHGDIVQEKQRFAACACNIVYAHGNAVDTDGIMLVHKKGELDLGSDTICTGYQGRLFHILDLFQGKCTGKTAQSAKHFRAHCRLYILFHQFHRFVSGFNIHSRTLVIHLILHTVPVHLFILCSCDSRIPAALHPFSVRRLSSLRCKP